MVKWIAALMSCCVVTFFWSCQVKPLDVEGLRCSEDRVCGDGFWCVDQICMRSAPLVDDGGVDSGTDDDAGLIDSGVPDASMPDAGSDAGIDFGVNLLTNASFEDFSGGTPAMGEINGWSTIPGKFVSVTSSVVRGVRAVRAEATSTSQLTLRSINTEKRTQFGMFICGAIWARTDVDGGVEAYLNIRDIFLDGGNTGTSGTKTTLTNEWKLIKEDYVSQGDSHLQLRLFTIPQLKPGQGLYADEARLSREVPGGCP